MKYKLPILTVVVVLALAWTCQPEKTRILLSLLRSSVHTPSNSSSSNDASPVQSPASTRLESKLSRDVASAAESDASRAASNKVIGQGIQNLGNVSFLESKLRLHVELLGQSLSGVGTYLQSGGGETLRSRFELKMEVADKVASFLQISDGRFVWQRDDLDKDPRLMRIDLRRLREETETEANSDRLDSPRTESVSTPRLPWMLLGGMPRFLRDLDDNFQFQSRNAKRGDIPVTILEGQWRPERLHRIVPSRRGGFNQSTPAFLPHFVRLTLGRDEELPGFPYLIEFFRTNDHGPWNPADVTQIRQLKPYVTMEIYEVRVPPAIDESLFKYNPANQDVIDRTSELLE